MKTVPRLLALLCLCLISHLSLCQCISIGPRTATAFSNNTGTGTLAWSNIGNVVLSDDITASAGKAVGLFSSVKTNYLVLDHWGFAIPPAATVCGIEVTIERRLAGVAIGSSVTDHSIRIVKNGGITGTDHANTTNWTTTDASYTYGNSSDKWAPSWVPAEINAPDFGIAIAASLNAGLVGLFITAHIDQVRITIYYSNPVVMPVTLEKFSVRLQQNKAVLAWTASTNTPGDVFTPERSADNEDWQQLAVIRAESRLQDYTYTDQQPLSGNSYYRLAMQGQQEAAKYSTVQRVTRRTEIASIRIYPNPATDRITIMDTENMQQVLIKDLQGRLVRTIRLEIGTKKYELSLHGLQNGLYLLEVDGALFKFLKQGQ